MGTRISFPYHCLVKTIKYPILLILSKYTGFLFPEVQWAAYSEELSYKNTAKAWINYNIM